MTNILDTTPDAEAYAFTYRFQVGHDLRPVRMSQLRIEAERSFDETRLFLEPAGLVQGIEDTATPLQTSVPLGVSDLTVGEVKVIPVLDWRTAKVRPHARGMSPWGLTVSISAGTEFGVSPSPAEADEKITIRFPRETDVEIGVHPEAAAFRRHRARGFQPVSLNGAPLLEIVSPAPSVHLHMTGARTAILSLLVVVSPYRRRGKSALYHIVEAIGDRVVGGTSLQFRV